MRLVICTIVFAVLLSTASHADEPKKVRVPVSKQTTWITGPLRKDGTVDYAKALNARLSKGVTPQNNAVLLLVQVLGPKKFPAEVRNDYFKALDLPAKLPDGPRFLSLEDFALLKAGGKKESRYADALYHEQGESTAGPWSRKKYPRLAAWLDHNRASLKVIVKAAGRSHWYEPIVPIRHKRTGRTMLRSLLNDNLRGFGRALTARVRLAIQEGRIDDAQRDLIAIRRLARLASHGLMTERQVGVAFEAMAFSADEHLLHSGRQSLRQLQAYRRALAGRPTAAPFVERFAFTDRIVDLASLVENAQSGRQGQAAAASAFRLLDFQDKLKNLQTTMFAGPLDWKVVLKSLNEGWKEFGLDSRDSPPYRALAIAATKVNTKHRLRLEAGNRKARLKQPERSRLFADFMLRAYALNLEHSLSAENRAICRNRLIQVAYALAHHKRVSGKYPAKLCDLKTKYLAEVPNDLFTGKPLKYKLSKKGYLLYSIGENRKDDGGRAYCAGFERDDLVLRMDGSKEKCP